MIHRSLVLALVVACGVALLGQSLTPGPETTTLLEEVRALRIAIERLATNGARAQLLLGRVQLQEQRISDLAGRLQRVRDQVASLGREAATAARVLEDLEAAPIIRTPEEQAALDQEISRTKARLEQFNASARGRRTEEAELAGLLASEQARWAEFNQRLEELERTLTAR